jgi:hypothetical protein
MAYTQSPDRAKTELTFGGLVNDANRNALAVTGNRFVTRDATASPVTSPVTLGSGTTTLTVPPNAITLTVNPKTAVVKVSEDSTNSAYFTVPVALSQDFPVARQAYVYLTGTNDDAVDFYFTLV